MTKREENGDMNVKGFKTMHECEHKTHDLIGTADGIYCQGCGKLFKSYSELEADTKSHKAHAEEQGKPKKKKKEVK